MEPTAERQEFPLHFSRSGSGPTIVLLHPIGLDGTTWDAVAARLSRDFTVLQPDALGHGNSPQAPADATLSDYAAAVHALLAAQNLGPAAVIGLSFGGMIAQTLAIEHPDDVAALVVAGCSSASPPDRRAMMTERGAAAERDGMAAVIDATLQRWFTPDFLARGGASNVEQQLRDENVRSWATGWRAIAGLDTAPRLGEIAVPTLAIAGEKDLATPMAALEAIARNVQHGRFALLPDAPHMMQLEQPQGFAELVGEFLKENLPRS